MPVVVFFCSVIAILYHFGVMQAIIRTIGRLLAFGLGTTPAESLNVAGNMFIGQVMRQYIYCRSKHSSYLKQLSHSLSIFPSLLLNLLRILPLDIKNTYPDSSPTKVWALNQTDQWLILKYDILKNPKEPFSWSGGPLLFSCN